MSYQAAQPSLFQQLPTSMRLPQMAEQLRDWRGEQAALVTLAALGTLLLLRVLASLARTARIARVLRPVPIAPGANLLLGHVIPLLTIPSKGRGAWDLMCDWAAAKGPIVRCRILSTQNVIVSDPLAAKRIFQHRFKVYAKDTVLSYKPFMPILGTGEQLQWLLAARQPLDGCPRPQRQSPHRAPSGYKGLGFVTASTMLSQPPLHTPPRWGAGLVTSEGELWQKQRLLMGPALRVDVLDDIISIAKRATDRFSEKFETLRGSGQPVSMEEEFRLLTLQVGLAGWPGSGSGSAGCSAACGARVAAAAAAATSHGMRRMRRTARGRARGPLAALAAPSSPVFSLHSTTTRPGAIKQATCRTSASCFSR